VLYETEFALGMYEPATGCYLGADLYNAEGGMKLFEGRAEKKHAVYTVEMHMGGGFPETWMLSCIAAQGTPLVYLHGHDGVFSLYAAKEAADWLGAYNIPLFVAYRPFAAIKNEAEAAAYRHQYRTVRALFKEYAPKAAFVWLADVDGGAHYPGHDAVDWVGTRFFMTWNGENYASVDDAAIKEFYLRHQSHKPVMLAGVGVSHFSEADYTYRIAEAAGALRQLYDTVRYAFPRIKLISYADAAIYGENFSVTGDTALLDAYKNSAGHPYFLSAMTDGKGVNQWLRSERDGFVLERQVYVSACTAGLPAADENETVSINGVPYIDVEKLSGRFSVVNHERRTINVYGSVEP
jgi:hypothetical protein